VDGFVSASAATDGVGVGWSLTAPDGTAVGEGAKRLGIGAVRHDEAAVLGAATGFWEAVHATGWKRIALVCSTPTARILAGCQVGIGGYAKSSREHFTAFAASTGTRVRLSHPNGSLGESLCSRLVDGRAKTLAQQALSGAEATDPDARAAAGGFDLGSAPMVIVGYSSFNYAGCMVVGNGVVSCSGFHQPGSESAAAIEALAKNVAVARAVSPDAERIAFVTPVKKAAFAVRTPAGATEKTRGLAALAASLEAGGFAAGSVDGTAVPTLAVDPAGAMGFAMACCREFAMKANAGGDFNVAFRHDGNWRRAMLSEMPWLRPRGTVLSLPEMDALCGLRHGSAERAGLGRAVDPATGGIPLPNAFFETVKLEIEARDGDRIAPTSDLAPPSSTRSRLASELTPEFDLRIFPVLNGGGYAVGWAAYGRSGLVVARGRKLPTAGSEVECVVAAVAEFVDEVCARMAVPAIEVRCTRFAAIVGDADCGDPKLTASIKHLWKTSEQTRTTIRFAADSGRKDDRDDRTWLTVVLARAAASGDSVSVAEFVDRDENDAFFSRMFRRFPKPVALTFDADEDEPETAPTP
jgi:hypothetical protein